VRAKAALPRSNAERVLCILSNEPDELRVGGALRDEHVWRVALLAEALHHIGCIARQAEGDPDFSLRRPRLVDLRAKIGRSHAVDFGFCSLEARSDRIFPEAIRHLARAGIVARVDCEATVAHAARNFQCAGAVRRERRRHLEHVTPSGLLRGPGCAGCVYEHPPVALGSACRAERRCRAHRPDQQVAAVGADELLIECAGSSSLGTIIQQAQFDAPAEQPTGGIHFLPATAAETCADRLPGRPGFRSP
jgi:hypothetical protein